MQTLIGPFSQIITMDKLPLGGPIHIDQMEIVHQGGIILGDGFIREVGSFKDLEKNWTGQVMETDTSSVLLPGFVDSHTHICWAGSRAGDYAMKIGGSTYQEILKGGGGIHSTVKMTRQASATDLLDNTIERINRHFRDGVTTIEIKSGYGLSVGDELKMLEAIYMAGTKSDPDIVGTCLAAHVTPSEFATPEQYLEYLLEELLPAVKERSLSDRVDIFVEENAFPPHLALDYLHRAQKMGFKITVHADQFSTGGSTVAAQSNALSADHLEVVTEKEISLLKKNRVVATVLPGASLGLGLPFAPARKIMDAGCCLAIASDWNPGSAPMGDLLLQAALLSAYQKLSFPETLAGITFRAAKALDLPDRGIIKKGFKADLVAFSTNDYREILYNQGKMKPYQVWKNGNRFII